jgi:predicted TIM-barrel fold metal-dependent hydrolase
VTTPSIDDAVSTLGQRSPAGIIDCYVNFNPPVLRHDWKRVDYLFHRSHEGEGETADELVGSMDRYGIRRALLAPPPEPAGMTEEEAYRATLEAVQRHPTRFRLSVRLDPHEGMRAVRQLDSMVRNDGLAALRFVPFRVGRPLTDPVYYPLYTKCVELGIPITSTVGIPGPRVRGAVQKVIYLDDLCAAWPDLVVVSTHGGEPWTKLLAELLGKWPNLYHMLSAFAPRYYPEDLIRFASTPEGRRKLLFASDYPVISFSRSISELPGVPLADESWPFFLFENARAVFWGGE